jgi:hypothetical protein
LILHGSLSFYEEKADLIALINNKLNIKYARKEIQKLEDTKFQNICTALKQFHNENEAESEAEPIMSPLVHKRFQVMQLIDTNIRKSCLV